MSREPCRLYLISPPAFDPKAFADVLTATLDAGEVGAFQVRLKGAGDDALRRSVETLLKAAEPFGVPVILNDRPDLAAETGCHGVHIGQEDTPYRQARAQVGEDAIVGVTCHDSRHLAMEAAERGADYVAFGAFHSTRTKDAKTRAPLSLLTWWQELMVVPCVAIGGITVDNCRPMVDAGADFIAVSSGVWNHPEGPAAAVRGFELAFSEMAS